jgi:phosphopantetheinyl transferase (holo-ACP synthase)
MLVGNDVVDLTAERTRGKSSHQRFLDRILDPIERDYVASSSSPDFELWCLWAAKESAYKIASKLRETPPPFEHAAFGVRWSPDAADAAGDRAGTVRWQELEVVAMVTPGEGFVHAVAHAMPTDSRPSGDASPAMETIGVAVRRMDEDGAPWQGAYEALLKRLTPREADAVHSPASLAVRLGARAALAETLDVEEARLEIVCAPGQTGRRPPWVFLDGEPTGTDVSLSHDGPWLAWAWSVAGRSQSESGR